MRSLEKKLWLLKKRVLNCSRIVEDENSLELCLSSSCQEEGQTSEDELLQSFEEAKQLFSIQQTYRNSSTGISYNTFYCPPKDENTPILVCHHGAGSSAMTFWNLIKLCHDELGYGAFAYDARGHGDSSKSESMDLSLSLFVDDFVFVLHQFYALNKPLNTICLVGHSLGGSVLIEFLSTRFKELEYPQIGGIVVLDIVEELATKALISTDSFNRNMPKSFRSYLEAVQWHLDSRLLHNYDSAKVSVYHLIEPDLSGRLTWKCKFDSLSEFWSTWFPGFSKKFIESTKGAVSKLLILSTNETLDKDLMIGQMQGKYQLIVLNNSSGTGHFVHEDVPKKSMLSVLNFIRRIELSKKMQSEKLWKHAGGSVNFNT